MIVQPGAEAGVFRSGSRAVVLSGGSMVGSTLDGEILASAQTNGEGNFTLELPAGTGSVVVSAAKDPVDLKAVVTRLPSEGTVVDAVSATVAALTEQGVNTVGTEVNLEMLVDSLKTQVDRPTSLLNDMSKVHQSMIDELVKSGSARTNGESMRGLSTSESFSQMMMEGRVRQKAGSAAAALTSVNAIGAKLRDAVTGSQSVQTLLGEQYNFGSMLNDFTSSHAREMAQLGISHQEIVGFVENLTMG